VGGKAGGALSDEQAMDLALAAWRWARVPRDAWRQPCFSPDAYRQPAGVVICATMTPVTDARACPLCGARHTRGSAEVDAAKDHIFCEGVGRSGQLAGAGCGSSIACGLVGAARS
jgi:hypothetical protein